MKKTPLNIAAFSVTCIAMILCTLLEIHVSSVLFIFAAGVIGLLAFIVKTKKAKGEKK